MEVSTSPGPDRSTAVSYEAVLSALRCRWAARIRKYEESVSWPSPYGAVILLCGYSVAYWILVWFFPRVLLASGTIVGGGVAYSVYLHVTQHSGQLPDTRPTHSAAAVAVAAVADSEQLKQDDHWMLKCIALVYYAGHYLNAVNKQLSPNRSWVMLGSIPIVFVIGVYMLPTKIIVYLAGCCVLGYPSWKFHGVTKMLEPYFVQFVHLHAATRAQLKPARRIVSSSPAAGRDDYDDDDEDAMEVDEEFQRALVEELETATSSAASSDDENSGAGGGEYAPEDDMLHDSLLGLEHPSAMETVLRQQFASTGADMWDFNQTVDLDDDFAQGLSFASLTPSMPPGREASTAGQPTSLQATQVEDAAPRHHTSPDLTVYGQTVGTQQQRRNESEVSSSSGRHVVTGPSVSAEPRIQSHTLRSESPAGTVTTSSACTGDTSSSGGVYTGDTSSSGGVAGDRSSSGGVAGDTSSSGGVAGDTSSSGGVSSGGVEEGAGMGRSLVFVNEEHFAAPPPPVPAPAPSSSSVRDTQACNSSSSDISIDLPTATASAPSREEFEVITQEEAAAVPIDVDVSSPESQPSAVEQVSNALAAQGTYLKSWLAGGEQ